MTIGNHSLPVNTSIQIAPNSLTFTCDKDGNATQHTYPRVTDPAYNTALNIDATTSDSITVNVGVSPTTSGVVTRTISNASYDPATGVTSVSMPASSIPTGFGQNSTSRVSIPQLPPVPKTLSWMLNSGLPRFWKTLFERIFQF